MPCIADVVECKSHPCKNGGTCTDVVNGYKCKCIPGFTGVICESSM